MRDYSKFDDHLSALTQDVYSQPPDSGHTAMALHAVKTLCSIPEGLKNVLDIGCGQGFLKIGLENMGLTWEGLVIGEDYFLCKEAGLPVHNFDMTFVDLPNKSYDLLFARHVLEHSPFPLITLMEWHRISRGYLALIAPAPAYWSPRGKNHYAVLEQDHLAWLLMRAGWHTIHEFTLTTQDRLFVNTHPTRDNTGPVLDVEYRFLCRRSEVERE